MADTRKDSSSTVVAKKPAILVSDVMKLALFQSQAVSPIMTHQELAPILAKLGFFPGRILEPIPLPGAVSWQTYAFTANSIWRTKLQNKAEEQPPTVRLPYPEIDGLHEMTYQAFLHAIDFYLDLGDKISSILHVRRTQVAEGDVERGRWSMIEESEKGRYIFRTTTLDTTALDLILKNRPRNHQDHDGGNDDDDNDDANTRYKTRRTSGSSSSSSSAVNVPLKHIITNLKE